MEGVKAVPNVADVLSSDNALRVPQAFLWRRDDGAAVPPEVGSRRARDMPAAAHARPRRDPTGLGGRARQRAPSAWASAECVCRPWAGLAPRPGVFLVAI